MESRIFPNLHVRLTWQDLQQGWMCPIYYLRRYPALPYLDAVYFHMPFSNNQYNDLLRLYYLLGIGIAEMKAEELKLGRAVPVEIAPYFRVTLVYKINVKGVLK